MRFGKASLQNPTELNANVNEFRKLADQMTQFGAAEGVTITGYTDPTLPAFRRSEAKKQQQVLAALQAQVELFEVAASEGLPLRSPQAIWRILKKMNIVPESDLFDKILIGDTVEIYMSDGTSFFKNLTFFEYITMSIEDLYCEHWIDLMGLSAEGYLYFMEMTIRLKLGMINKGFCPSFNTYRIWEKRGQKRTFNINLKWMSPLAIEGKKTAVMLVNRSAIATI